VAELVAQQPMSRAERPQRTALLLGCERPRPRDRGVEEDDARSAGEPVGAQGLDRREQPLRIEDLGATDAVARPVAPACRDVGVRVRDDPPTEERPRPVRPGGRVGAQAAGSAA